jgi:hypothetical protein
VLVAEGVPPDVAAQLVPAEAPFSPVYFHIPVTVVVGRRNDKPASGEKPPLEDQGKVPCAGGDGGGGPAPTPDCGRREFKGSIDVTGPKPMELYPVMVDPPEAASNLYSFCSGNDPAPGAFALDWDASELKMNGGRFPDAGPLFDPDVPRIEISGAATARHVEPGFLITEEYEWTVTLCRLTDGQPSPEC